MSCLLLGFCFSIIGSFVVLKTPETVSTRDEDFKQSPGEACPILLLDMENVTCLRRAISFCPLNTRSAPQHQSLRLSLTIIIVWVNHDATFTNVLLYNAEF